LDRIAVECKMVKRKKTKRASSASHSTRAPSVSSESEFVLIDDKQFSKNEILSYISVLKSDAEKQNVRISELSALVIELKKLVDSSVQIQNTYSNKPLNNVTSDKEELLNNYTNNSPQNTDITGANKNSSNDSSAFNHENMSLPDDEMDTCSIIDDLLFLPLTHNNSNPETSTHSEDDDISILRDRNKALLSFNNNNDSPNSIALNRSKTKANSITKNASTAIPVITDTVHQSNTFNTSNRNKGSNSNTKPVTNNSNNSNNTKILISKPQGDPIANEKNKLKFNKKICPEIIVFNMENKKQTINHIKSLLGHDRVLFKFINKDKTSILTESVTDRKKILDFLKNNLSRFITFTPSDEKPLILVIKYIDKSFNIDDIKEGILKLDKDIKIISLKILESSKPLAEKNIWILQVEKNEKSKSLIGKKNICFSIVNIESFKSNAILQCKRCQHFNHSASNCHQPYRCVKCGKQQGQTNDAGEIIGHEPGQCPLNKSRVNGVVNSSDLFCCNCNKYGHTANYKKCEKYVEQMGKKNIQIQSNEQKKSMFSNFVSSGQSFAQQLNNNNKHSPTNIGNINNQKPVIKSNSQNVNNSSNMNSSNNSFLESECIKYFGSNMFELLGNINKFLPLYKKLESNQKPLKLLEFLIHISDKNGSK
jgi:hypothetical protein